MLYVFTTSALNFVPCAKLLCQSVKSKMTNVKFVFGLTDRKPADFNLEDEGFDEVLYLDDFAEELGNPLGWAFGHDIMELATALKPFVAAKLMERSDCEGVMFFDPDCVVLNDMTPAIKELETASVLLTPHACDLHVNDQQMFFEFNPLKVGSFNLGFFCFKNDDTGRAVANWWRKRLRDYCLIDPDRGLFTDQKWMDLLPSYIDTLKVLRSPVYNIARWNTFQRPIEKRGDDYYVRGQKVQFIHFSGFYKVGPYVRGLYDRQSEKLIKNREVLDELSLWYSSELTQARTQPAYIAPWALGRYGNGVEIPSSHRRRYKSETQCQERYPDPFDVSRLDSFYAHCLAEDAIEAETRFESFPEFRDAINHSVRGNNQLLREYTTALEDQVRALQAEHNHVRADLSSLLLARNQLLLDLRARLSKVAEHDLKAAFSGTPSLSVLVEREGGGDGWASRLAFLRSGLFDKALSSDEEASLFLDVHLDTLIGLAARA